MAAASLLSGCSDFVVTRVTPTPFLAPVESLPPIGYNHRYGNNPVASADGFDFERSLFSQQVFWEVGIRSDPQLAGFVDRAKPAAVAQARGKATSILITLATERLQTIQQMLAFAQNTDQEGYCIEVLNHFRNLGYSNITKATVLVFFTEQDEHSVLDWTVNDGYKFTVYDNNLAGNTSIRPGATITALPAPPS